MHAARLDSLHMIERACWRELDLAAHDRLHAWHVLTLATVDGTRATRSAAGALSTFAAAISDTARAEGLYGCSSFLYNRSMLVMVTRTASPSRRARSAATQGPTRPDRQMAILLAAEKLFAQRGYHAVTIRQIADEAAVPLALVGYYYGQKHELFHAIFEHWNRTIEERLAALQSVSHDPRDPETLRRIIDAFTGPVLRLRASSEGEYYALLVARELYGQAFFGGTVTAETQERVRKQLVKNIAGFQRLARFGPYVAGDSFTLADCAAYVSLPLVALASKKVLGEDLLAAAGIDWKAYNALVGGRPSAQKVSADRKAAQAQFVFIALAFFSLMGSFAANDFSVLNVATNSNSELPLAYRIAATWGSHEGSMLLWVFMLSLWTFAVSVLSRRLPLDMVARVLGVMGFIASGLLLFVLLTSNPFKRLVPAALEGRDLNPLLQDPGMVIHPPMLYMGYVGFSVAFAFAVAALIGGRLDATWARWTRPWTTAAWIFLTLGIALGSWWAYYELGWGGWWFWDPVENASFMPWLIGAALLHSAIVTEKRGALPGWTAFLALAAFTFSMLGAFLVRSGVLTSVHAFAVDPTRGVLLLTAETLAQRLPPRSYVASRSFVLAVGETLGIEAFRLRLADDLARCDRGYLTVCLDVLPGPLAPGVAAPAALAERMLQLGQSAFQIAFGQRVQRFGFFGGGFDFLGRGQVLVQEGADLGLGQGPDEAVHRLAALEHHAERDRAHTEGLAQLAGDLGLVVAVELGQLEAAGVGGLQAVEHRAELLARAAPGCPDVEQHRLLHRALDQFGFEILEGDIDHRGVPGALGLGA